MPGVLIVYVALLPYVGFLPATAVVTVAIRYAARLVDTIGFLYAAGVPIADTSHVVFTGGAPTVTALAGGHVDFCGQQKSESAGLIEGKKIRALAVVNATRVSSLPDVPTAKEVGFPELDVVGWNALLEEAAKDPAEAFWQFQQDELKKYVPLATKMGIRK